MFYMGWSINDGCQHAAQLQMLLDRQSLGPRLRIETMLDQDLVQFWLGPAIGNPRMRQQRPAQILPAMQVKVMEKLMPGCAIANLLPLRRTGLYQHDAG